MLDRSVSDASLSGEHIAGKHPDEIRFLQSWFQNPLRTGAVSPSGRALARKMASYVDPGQAGPVIELGPGTGPVTSALIERGIAEERLVLIEYNPQFCTLLKQRYPLATVIRGDAYNMARTLDGQLDAKAVAVVSSLPLFTRPVPERRSLCEQAFGLCVKDAPLIQFTYAVVSPLPLDEIPLRANRSRRIWRNIPPACVWVYRSAPLNG
ncbi:phospholipid methyltransferase [Ancylobacter sp. 6x-1]|uniref:Phospholipid methyltransferase n=1 Tax=Ancylobacter crimeensis TaxID=2579147 RepID=A0ABT0DAJ0_9HYPH|nr:rRNA adenine N-6-methyltransferase family protein [Ancylobacter crimeensis]MCK0196909.1 phospholipid methyltransferase [Ancylobacter crimeensis]